MGNGCEVRGSDEELVLQKESRDIISMSVRDPLGIVLAAGRTYVVLEQQRPLRSIQDGTRLLGLDHVVIRSLLLGRSRSDGISQDGSHLNKRRGGGEEGVVVVVILGSDEKEPDSRCSEDRRPQIRDAGRKLRVEPESFLLGSIHCYLSSHPHLIAFCQTSLGRASPPFITQNKLATMAVTKTSAAPKPSTGKSKAAVGQKYFIDFSGPAADGILDSASFEKFLHDRIKVDGKAGQLGDVVKVQKEGE